MTRARDLAAFVSNADGDIKFDTDTLFIDSSANRVGIGETAPERVLHIKSADNIIGLIESTDADAWLAFQDDTSASNNAVRVGATGDNLRFYAGSAERMRIDDNGNVGIGVTPESSSGTWRNLEFGGGNLTFRSGGANDAMVGTGYVFKSDNSEVYKNTAAVSRLFFDNNTMKFQQAASGTAGTSISWSEELRIDSDGLKFNGDTAANNALSDYEIGTFTPSYDTSDNNASGQVYGASTKGSYVKIGRMIHFQLTVHLSSLSSAGTGSPQIRGLPYTSSGSAITNESTRFTVSTYSVNFQAATGQFLHAYLPTINVSYLQFLTTNDGAAWSVNNTSGFAVVSGSFITISGNYITN